MKTPTKLFISGLLMFIAFVFYCHEEWFVSHNVADALYGTLAWAGFFFAFKTWTEVDSEKKVKTLFGKIAWNCFLFVAIITLINVAHIFFSKDDTNGFGLSYMFFSCVMYFCLAGYLTIDSKENKIEKVLETSSVPGDYVMD